MDTEELKVGERYDFETSDGTVYANALLAVKTSDGGVLIRYPLGFAGEMTVGIAPHELAGASRRET